jgi:hypothetical protein
MGSYDDERKLERLRGEARRIAAERPIDLTVAADRRKGLELCARYRAANDREKLKRAQLKLAELREMREKMYLLLR